MKKLTQREKILKVLREVRDGRAVFPIEYIKTKDGEAWLSSRYLKQVMLISEANGRISEARADGYDIATLTEKDEFGFAYHRLVVDVAPKKQEYKIVALDQEASQFGLPFIAFHRGAQVPISMFGVSPPSSPR